MKSERRKMRKLKVIVAKSRSSRYGRPRYIAFSTQSQSSVEMVMSGLDRRGNYSLQFGTLILGEEKYK
jgi:hypothetical protein